MVLQIQVTPPTSSRQQRRRVRGAFEEQDEQDDDAGKNDDDDVHPSLSSLHLPAPDPSCEIVNIFGTPRTDEIGQLEHVWAHQIATIVFSNSDNDLSDKPVVVGFGWKPAFLANNNTAQDLGEIRIKYAQVMQLCQSVVSS
jgi:hypothetical protein